ncbi:MAG: class II aldolase/adducin family protein [Phycisphaeraceae bacterium]|nr:class II aldolase/adducin family protein [Phycisphaeraceae bacterium]
MKVDDSKYATFVAAAHKVAQYGLVQCSSGNLSWRVGSDEAMLSASGAWLAELTAKQIALCELSSGQCLNDVKPTCEAGFHLGILKAHPDANVVLHFQSPYATALACGDPTKYNLNLTIEVPVYIGDAAVVEYLPPGSNELAEAVANALTGSDTQMAILKNHGLVTLGKTFDDAIQKAIFFEQACQICLTNPDAKPLGPDAVAYLHELGKA